MIKNKIAIIVQARLGSTRLPQKVIKNIYGQTILDHLVHRLQKLSLPIYLIVPIGEKKEFQWLEKKNVILFEGSHENVLERYYQCAKQNKINTIIRATGDNPLTSEYCLNYGLKEHMEKNYDISHVINIPHGSGVEYIEYNTLEKINNSTTTKEEKEHVTLYAYNHDQQFLIGKILPPPSYKSSLRVTIDTQEDFDQYQNWIKQIGLEKGLYLSLEKVLSYNKSKTTQ